jgi:hypothetical protein
VHWKGYQLAVTAAGRPFVRNVAATFDSHLRTSLDCRGVSMIDYERFIAAPLAHTPYDHLVVPSFVPYTDAIAAATSFPAPDLPGVLPAPAHPRDDACGHLSEELRTPRLT